VSLSLSLSLLSLSLFVMGCGNSKSGGGGGGNAVVIPAAGNKANGEYDYLFKLLIIGDSGVGKSW
jgi:hypothetical protein